MRKGSNTCVIRVLKGEEKEGKTKKNVNRNNGRKQSRSLNLWIQENQKLQRG